MSKPFINWIASYPRSGNTWLRALLLAYREGDDFDLNRMQGIPGEPSPAYYRMIWSGKEEYDLNDWAYMRAIALKNAYESRRTKDFVLKTHTANVAIGGTPLIPKSYTNKVVYIVRDVRDVLCSCSRYFNKSHDEMLDLMENENHMLTDEKSGIWQFVSSYAMHLKSWANEKSFHVYGVKYSALLEDPTSELIKILRFFDPDAEVNLKEVKRAVHMTIKKNFIDKEKADGFREKPPGVKTFFNTGETEWKDELDPNVIERAVKMVLKR